MFAVGAVASGINAVAGGGSLISFPVLTLGFGIPSVVANATNSVALWPGSLAAAVGFRNALPATRHYLRSLLLPTLLGSIGGAWLLTHTPERAFDFAVPGLIFIAAMLLMFQPQIKRWANVEHAPIPTWGGMGLQFLVAIYGGYFGAGMGIMMLATFALYMVGTIHELNAVKTWLGVVINATASLLFLRNGLVVAVPALALTAGSIVGGFAAARFSQRFDSESLRKVIAWYGLAMAGYFAWRAFKG